MYVLYVWDKQKEKARESTGWRLEARVGEPRALVFGSLGPKGLEESVV